jgi:integrase
VARGRETIGARWAEFDFDRKIWTVPGERMKAGKEHRVPISNRVIEILESVRTSETKPNDFIFPGLRRGTPLSNMAMLELLRLAKARAWFSRSIGQNRASAISSRS